MTKARPVQASMFPDIAPDKPTGRILSSVFVGTNADLMAAVAPYYLTGSVLDVTYGEGKWWERFKPQLTAHDLKLDGVDFTALPETDASYDAVCFDPPYITTGGLGSSSARIYSGRGGGLRDRYGLAQRSQDELWALISGGMSEAARVVRPGGFVLVKCMDFADTGLTLGHRRVLDIADDLSLECHDLIVHHTGSGPGGHNIFDPKRARRHHSYLLVFVRVIKGKRRNAA